MLVLKNKILYILFIIIVLPPFNLGMYLSFDEILFVSISFLFILIILFYKKANFASYLLPYFIYSILFLLVGLISILLSFSYFDIGFFSSQFKNILITLVLGIFFSIALEGKKITIKEILVILFILTIPSILGFFQFFDIFNFKNIIKNYYAFNLNATYENYLTFRVNSVFTEFYTATIYYFIVTSFLVWFYFKVKLDFIQKILIIIFIISNLLIQIITARTGLVFSIFFTLVILFLNIKYIRYFFIKVILFLAVCILCLNLFFNINDIESKALLRTFEFFSNDNISSTEHLSEMNRNFIIYLSDNIKILFFPIGHVQNPSNFYTDSYYFQEIMRYGIYGLFSISIFYFLLFYKFRKNFFAIFTTLLLIVANYKGGNVFFMEKVSYVFVLLLILSRYINKEIYNENNL